MAAAQGHVRAQYNLGKFYRDGRGVGADEAASIRWFRAAAEGGYAKAQAKLASRYAVGRGVARDALEAYVWTALAAAGGHEGAKAALSRRTARLSQSEKTAGDARVAAFRPKSGG